MLEHKKVMKIRGAVPRGRAGLRAGSGGIAVLCLVLSGCGGGPTGPAPITAVEAGTAPAAAPAVKVSSVNGVRIGVVDPQKVLEETDAGKRAKDSLSNFMKNRQSLIELEEKELKRMEEDIIKQASILSASARREREEQFRRRAIEFQQKANELNREIQEKQKEVLEAFREKVERIVAKVAQQMGLLVVMEKGRGGPTVYNDSALDISPQVIEEFNRSLPGKPKDR
jgi:outer membrane protein